MAWPEGPAVCHVLHSLVLEYTFLFSIFHSSKKIKQDLSLSIKAQELWAWRSPGSHWLCQGSESQALAREGAPWLQTVVSQQDTCKPKALSPESGHVGRDHCNMSVWHAWMCRDRGSRPKFITQQGYTSQPATSPGKLWFNYSQCWETSFYFKNGFL